MTNFNQIMAYLNDEEELEMEIPDPANYEARNYNSFISDATDIEMINKELARQVWNARREEVLKRKKKQKGNKMLFDGEVLRRDGKLFLRVKIAPEVEEWLEAKCRKEQSGSWKDGEGYHEFYHFGDVEGQPRRFMNNHHNNYGGDYFDVRSNKVNVAIIRTVGISEEAKEFVMMDKYSKQTLQEGMLQLRDFTKKLYKKFIKQVRVRGKATIYDYVED